MKRQVFPKLNPQKKFVFSHSATTLLNFLFLISVGTALLSFFFVYKTQQAVVSSSRQSNPRLVAGQQLVMMVEGQRALIYKALRSESSEEVEDIQEQLFWERTSAVSLLSNLKNLGGDKDILSQLEIKYELFGMLTQNILGIWQTAIAYRAAVEADIAGIEDHFGDMDF